MIDSYELYTVIQLKRSLTDKERKELIDRIDFAGQGSWYKEELFQLEDRELAMTCIDTEYNYAMSQL